MTTLSIILNRSKFSKRLPKKLELFLSLTPIVVIITPVIIAFFDEKLAEWPKWLLIPFCAILTVLFFIGLFKLMGQILRAPFSLARFTMNRFETGRKKLVSMKRDKKSVKFDRSRRKFVTTSAAVVSSYAVFNTGMGVINKDDYEVIRKSITIKNLPPALRGTTISLVSDIHSGPYMSKDTMKEYVDAVNGLGSDIIVIPGDFTSTDKAEIKPLVNTFADLKAQYGVYATLGNHDYLSDPDYIAGAILADTGIKLLRNETSFIEKSESRLYISGIEDTKESMDSDRNEIVEYFKHTLDKAGTDFKDYSITPKLLLAHKPYYFPEISKSGIDLVLSGHTHGGQVVLAKFGGFNVSLASTISNYVSGLYSRGNSQMYVSRGIGSSTLPIRMNCRPEITLITLI